MNTTGLAGRGKLFLGYLKGLVGLNKTCYGLLTGKAKDEGKKEGRRKDQGRLRTTNVG